MRTDGVDCGICSCQELQGTGGNDGETDQDSCSSASDIEESSQEGRGAENDAGASPRTMALNWLQEPLAQVTREQLAQAAKEFASESLAAAEAEGQGETDDESQDSEDEEGWTLEEKVESAAEQEARAARVRAEKLHAQLCQSEDRSAGARDRLNAAASPKDSLRTADDRATQVTGLRLTGRRGQCIFPTSPPLATQEPLAVSPSDLTVPSPALSGALSSVSSILSSNLVRSTSMSCTQTDPSLLWSLEAFVPCGVRACVHACSLTGMLFSHTHTRHRARI